MQSEASQPPSIINHPPALLDGPRLLHHLVSSHSATDCAVDFLEDGSRPRKISYDSLHALSDRLACEIRHRISASKGTPCVVPVLVPQSPELYIALLAILKAGAAFCPLNLDAPEERLRFILDDVAASVLITTSELRSRLPLGNVSVLLVHEEVVQDGRECNYEDVDAQPGDLAYVLYTSGSTGVPKAVSVSHLAVTQSLLAHERHIPHFSRFLQFAAPTFDVSIFEIFFPLFRGETLVGCSRVQMLNDLPGVIKALAVDAAELTPTAVNNLLQGRGSVPGLKLLMTIGEMLTQSIVDEFGGNSKQESILWGMYGPTEAAIHCTLQPSFPTTCPVGNIGFPLDTVSAFIASPVRGGTPVEHLELLPIGHIGELIIGGPQVAKEYLNRPELTASVFIQHPGYGYLYRTGDKAKILPDGSIECLGRLVAGQIKLRGQRIELGEIEKVIAGVAGIRHATTAVFDDRLVAFCVTKTGEESKDAVVKACRRWLPSYMIPADIVFLLRMPQLPSGKIDKKTLEEQYVRDHSAAADEAGDRTEDNDASSPFSILRRVLGPNISSQTELAAAGLDSLRAIRTSSLLRRSGYPVDVVDILSAEHCGDLLKLCRSKAENEASVGQNCEQAANDHLKTLALDIPEVANRQAHVVDVLSCTPLQDAILAEVVSRPSAYCNWVEVEFSNAYTFEEIRGFLRTVIANNEILRSGFCATSSSSHPFLQIVWNDSKESQIVEVTQFSPGYTLGSTESWLRPLTIQVKASLHKPRVLFQIFHAIYDGWSFDILLQELNNVVQGVTLRRRPQFRDVVMYYSGIKDRGDFKTSCDYWKKLLGGYHTLAMPNYHGRTAPKGKHRSLSRSLSISSKVLDRRALDLRISAQVFAQAALAYLLASYLGTSDVVLGTVTSGRTIPVANIEEILGPCIASLPLRVDLSEVRTLQDVLLDIQDSNRSMLKHSTVPLREIKRMCGMNPGDALFEVLFVWQESLISRESRHSVVNAIDGADDLEFKLTIELEPREGRIQSRVTYDPSFFPEQQINIFCRQMDELITSFIEPSSANILMGDFRGYFSQESLSIANPQPQELISERSPSHSVEDWARKTPDHPAVIIGKMFGGSMKEEIQISYATLNRRANQLANALCQIGVGEDEPIAIVLEKSVNLYVAILAVAKLGVGYVPVTPETPLQRTMKILQEAGIKICISEGIFSKPLRHKTPYEFVDLDDFGLEGFSRENLGIKHRGSNLSYAVFTSGSTGVPKGVLVTQDNLMSNLHTLQDLYPVPEGSRLLQSCSQAFDVSVFEIFFTWHCGITLCTATKDELFYDLERAINALGVTHLSLTPTVAALVNPDNVPKVNFLVTAGEAVTQHVRRQWANRGLFQGYGPSETTNICTIKPFVTKDDLINNIGPPLKNTSALILHPGSNYMVPKGAVGELCFGGDQVCRGYLNMPELTAAKFLDHPGYGRIYRSGDLGIMLSDDSILFTGRADDQVKIRGQRVELGEINSCVLDCEGVRDCASILFGRSDGFQKLLTFWVPLASVSDTFEVLQPASHISTISAIFDSLSSRLPAYMIPTNLLPISRIPMTAQAKIDKRLLVATFEALPQDYLESVAGHSPVDNDDDKFSDVEKHLATIFSQAVGLSEGEVKRNASFFNLGLDSISAIAFSSRLRASGIADISVSFILQNPTIARLATQIGNRATEDPTPDTKGIPREFRDETISQIRDTFRQKGQHAEKILPCTSLQEAMLSSIPSKGSMTYCNKIVFAVNGDISRLHDCWESMFKRHEILRTCFMPTDDPSFAFAQVVLGFETLPWDEIESSTSELDTDINRYVTSILPTFTDPSKPPVRLAAIKYGRSSKLLFCCHHAVYDGVAVSTLLHEVEQAYKGLALESPVPYEPYLTHMASQDLDVADRFWESSLSNFEPTYFPEVTGKSRATPEGASYASLTHTLHTPLDEVLEACRQFSISLLSVTQAVWARLLHFYLGEDDFCFGNVMSGRTLPLYDLQRLVAPCFNTIPVRVHFDFNKSNLELARILHDYNVQLNSFQLTPLRRIQSKFAPGGARLFDTLFILQQPSEDLDNTIWELEEDAGEMDVPVVVEISQHKSNNTLNLRLHYDRSLLSESAAEMIAETFSYTLASCINSPHATAVDSIHLPAHLLSDSNPQPSPFPTPTGVLLHSAFEHNASARPDVEALDYQYKNGQRTTWTFRELNDYANRIANALLNHQIRADDVVPVCMDKSPQYYASILGVLKAGAAFTPFQPDLPEDRKKFMLSEICASVILCAEDDDVDWCPYIESINVNCVEGYPASNPNISGLRPTNLAYCLYTSGSTGKPKAVSMEHRSPIQTIESSKLLIPWNHKTRLLQYAAITFDMCYYDCFLAWSFGFCLCAADQSVMLNSLSHVINSMQISFLDLTPSIATSITKKEVPGVEFLHCIGEPMRPEIVREWEGRCVNSYGPTEAAFCCTMFPVHRETNTTVIGKPFPTTSFAVLPQGGGRTLPILSIGELYIGGSQLARGYFGNDELTESRFSYVNGQRFYKSGDLVRTLSDGNFEFIGRTDDQVKIRGLRVELGEINHVLHESDERIMAVSTQILKKSQQAKDQLVAFLAVELSGEEEDNERLKRNARERASKNLPTYMVPQVFVCIDRLPLSQAGKVDKNILLQAFRSSREADSVAWGTESDEEWTETEQDVRYIFAKLSRIPPEQIFRHTTIHQLGLDSISAVQIAAALRNKGFVVAAADVLKYPSCTELARELHKSVKELDSGWRGYDFESYQRRHRADILQEYALVSDNIEAIRPCTPLQKGIISQFIQKDGSVYFNYLHLQLPKDIEASRLRDAWQRAMQEHPMLRAGFTEIKDAQRSFAMVHYRFSTAKLPWEETRSKSFPRHALGKWIENSALYSLNHIHEPPWRLLFVNGEAANSLHLAISHALYDAQSLQQIFRTVTAAYHRQAIPPPSSLDSAVGEILNASNTDGTEHCDFWKRSGKDITPTHFPTMTPLRHEASAPLVVSRYCSRGVGELEAGCRKANITLQAAGIASWASILSAYTGEASVTCGVVLSGRTSEATAEVAFPCITTVPFTCRVNQDRHSMLRQIMSFSAAVQPHQFVPLNEIQRVMGYRGEQIFDSIFAYQKIHNAQSKDALWKVIEEKATVDYPISVEMEPMNDQLQFRITFLPHIVPQEQASLILAQLDYLLNDFISSLDASNICDPRLYSVTPPKEANLPSDVQFLHEFVEHSARLYPLKVAYEFATALHNEKYTSRCWTYQELDTAGNQIARLLQRQGIRPGELVGVCFDKCPEASFAMLGILKSGCAFVALDPTAPSARKAFIIKDSGAQVILSMRAQWKDFQGTLAITVVNLDEVDLKTFPTTSPTLERAISPQDRSYCLYTSGTTGTPKGCELTHENAVQALLAFQRLFAGHWDTDSRWLQFASFHFDVSVLEQYWSWSVGIRVVSAPRDLIFEDLAASIRTLGITHIDLTPSLARILRPGEVPSLCKGVFITGGEQLKQEILDVWGSKGVIYNGYGPTEATIGCTMYPRVPHNGKPSNIGRQFDNVGSYVLRPNSDVPVLRGGIGELCVSGKLVGKGYLNRADLTGERFPFLKRFQERVYRTGDLVRILHDNTFDFLGRADDQVKLRGQRLEIGEINAVIKQSDNGIQDVVTLVLKHPKQQKDQLVAFVVTRAAASSEGPKILLEHTANLASAKETCQDKLPVYMVPTHFVSLSAMPLSVNNKVDSKKLKEMYGALQVSDLQSLSGLSSSRDEAWSPTEEKIRDILCKVANLDTKDVQKSSSFFELGLDSVSVIGFSSTLRDAGLSGVKASLIMRNSSISRLSKALTSDVENVLDDKASVLAAQQWITAIQHRHRRSVIKNLGINAEDIEFIGPCTPLQEGMIARSLEDDQGLYFGAFHMELGQQVDITRLQAAWATFFKATEILRTWFCSSEEGFVQAILKNQPLPWKEVDIPSGYTMKDYLEGLKEEWWEPSRSSLKRPFELTVATVDTTRFLAVHIFHALYDGNSLAMMLKAVLDIYQGLWAEDARPSFQAVLPYGPLRLAKGAEKFWTDHISDDRLRPFPLLATGSEGTTTVVVRILSDIAGYEITRRKLSVTPQAIVQACWITVLQKYIKGPVTFGMIVSGRSIDFEGADRVIGPLFNTIPYQCRLQSGDTWKSISQKCHEFNVAAQPYQHTALRDTMKWCKRAPSEPFFDTLFVYQKVAEDTEAWADNEVWRLVGDDSFPDYPLALEVEQTNNNSLKLTLVSHGHISDQVTSSKILDEFETALSALLEEPGAVVPHITIEQSDTTTTESDDTIGKTTPLTDPHTPMESFEWTQATSKIREEIAKLAGVDLEDINAMTSIFELGLDSIDAIKLSSKLKKRGVDLRVSDIMRSLTISNMANRLSNDDVAKKFAPSESLLESQTRPLENYVRETGLPMDEIESVLPVTPLQEAMIAEMISSEYTRYFNHDVLQIAPGTDPKKLRNAWTRVVAGSPILRTSFVEVDDLSIEYSFAQIVRKFATGFWREINLDDHEIRPEDVFERIRKEAIAAKSAEPLFQIHYVTRQDQTYLILSIPHALYDGWSLGLLHEDVHRTYSDDFTPRPDYRPALQEILTTANIEAASFWKDNLRGIQTTSFPRRQVEEPPTSAFVHREERSSKIALDRITSFSKRHGISLQTLGQTIWSLALAFYTHALDVVFGCVLSGRDDEHTSEVLFPTMNTVAIRTLLHGSRREMLQYVQDNFSNVKQFQYFPLRKVQSLAGAQKKAFFDTLFIYQKRIGATKNEDQLYESVGGQSDVEYPVCVEMEVVDGELVWRCACKDEVLDEEQTQALLNRLDEVLKNVMESPNAPAIDFEASGVSICGLPSFKESTIGTSDDSEGKVGYPKPKHTSSPSSETAKKIREVLALVSQIPEDEITEDMTIFHIGLDSISAIKVSSLLRKQSVSLSVSEMLKAGSVQGMARIVDGRTPKPADTEKNADEVLQKALEGINLEGLLEQAGIESTTVVEVLPASAGQIYMLSTWSRSYGTLFYPTFSYKVSGNITFDILHKAWERLVSSNALLRTCFLATADANLPYVQVTLRSTEDSIFDITGIDDESRKRMIERSAANQPYVALFAEDVKDKWKLTLKIHHALYDGVSLPALMRNLQDLCRGTENDPVSISAFTQLLAVSASEDSRSKRKEFWTKYLTRSQTKRLDQPSDPHRARGELFKPGLLSDVTPLEERSRQKGLTTQSLFLAAYAKVYASILPHSPDESQDVVIGIYLANRSHAIEGLTELVAPTVNLVPLRVDKPHARDMKETAAQIQRDLQDISSANVSAVGLWEIADWTGVKIDTFVNFLKLPDGSDGDAEGDEGVKIEDANEQDREEYSRVVENGEREFEVPRELRSESVMEAYLPAIDVEATVRNGSLDIGVFCHVDMLDEEGANKLIEDIRAELVRFEEA